MIVSEKLHQNLRDYILFLFKKTFDFNKKKIISREKLEIQVIITIIVLTCSSKGFLIQAAVLV